ncbi:uncharacterized protein A1O5_04696 [Cladophialophora psammophila CBS 110553]|uniref:Uncharacterized protein n=1 Tax=Cladophialophora psammophila CBS 110553 TaxID=1182543 RepID=W9WVG5_9EURO|nr:uncharacterized protein A1O5_04696 [Cladophialophora psammophila CBS 110553]EXJ72192.1 hypothetical protein A1O5_04696 [Cladophialophora psammophila CBS 110553]
MTVKSRSAIPLFVFLAIALFFLPCATLVFICFHRRYRRKIEEKSRGEATDAVIESMPNWTVPIELGNIQTPPPPPPVAKILPIRSMQTRKSRHLPTRHSAIEGMNTLFEKRSTPNTTDVAARKPTKPSERHSMLMQNIEEYLAAAEKSPQNPFDGPVTALSSPLHTTTTHYSLQAALVTEQGPAEIQVRRAGERSAVSIRDAPRVKSQITKPEHATAAASPSPRVPSVDEACDGPPRQVPKAWM